MDKKAEIRQKHLDDSKERFKKILERKFKTTFIGAISEVEKGLGFLWDDENYISGGTHHDKLKEVMEKVGFTEDVWYEIWNGIRERILNNANNQLRGTLQELELHSVSYERYRMVLPVKSRNANHE